MTAVNETDAHRAFWITCLFLHVTSLVTSSRVSPLPLSLLLPLTAHYRPEFSIDRKSKTFKVNINFIILFFVFNRISVRVIYLKQKKYSLGTVFEKVTIYRTREQRSALYSELRGGEKGEVQSHSCAHVGITIFRRSAPAFRRHRGRRRKRRSL